MSQIHNIEGLIQLNNTKTDSSYKMSRVQTRYCSKENTQRANKYMKRCSPGTCKSKPKMMSPVTVRMTSIQKTKQEGWSKCGGKGAVLYWWDCKCALLVGL